MVREGAPRGGSWKEHLGGVREGAPRGGGSGKEHGEGASIPSSDIGLGPVTVSATDKRGAILGHFGKQSAGCTGLRVIGIN